MCRLPPLLPDSRHNLVVHCLMDYRRSAGAFLEKDLAILPLFVYNTALQEESYKNNKPSARLLNN